MSAAVVSKLLSFLLEPTYHWLALLILAYLLSLFKWKGVRRSLLILIGYIGIVLFSPAPLYMLWNLEEKLANHNGNESKPAVVILTGGTVNFNHELQQNHWHGNADRLLEPAMKWKDSESLFIVSGRSFGKKEDAPTLDEAESMIRFLEDLGIPEERIILENKARTTRENAERTVEILKERGIEDFYLVTSAFHMPRSMSSFLRLKVSPTAFPVDYQTESFELDGFSYIGAGNLRIFRLALHEYIGLLYYEILNLLED